MMKKLFVGGSILLIAALAHAEVVLENSYVYLPLKGSNATAGYMTLQNKGDKEVKFAVVSVEGFKKVESHETIEKDGRMSMQKVEDFVIPPKASLSLQPGGRHLMLFDPTKSFKPGDTVMVTYTLDGVKKTKKFKMLERTTEPAHHH
jgi:periplasmic copper chaperone A